MGLSLANETRKADLVTKQKKNKMDNREKLSPYVRVGQRKFNLGGQIAPVGSPFAHSLSL